MRTLLMIPISTAAIFALLSISGCETTATERDFGNSTRAMIQGQTADPMAAMVPDPDPIATGDGERLNTVIETYREPAPEATRQEVNSNPFGNRN
jgi:type IV pilus biogenesis protein CpaD/CtpE